VKALLSTLAIILFAALYATPAWSDSVKGTVILTKSSPVASLFWEATPRVFELANMEVPEAARVRLLEADALKILIGRAPATKAAEMSVQVVYLINPVAAQYGTPTMVGKAKLLFVRAKTADVIANGTAWAAAIAAGHVPKALTVTVQGQFPH
jgi:hypothetical protein